MKEKQPQLMRELVALLDVYEKSIKKLIKTLTTLTNDEFVKIIDLSTNDEDCRSIQTIMTHVIQSGYTYTIEIGKWSGLKNISYKEKTTMRSPKESINQLVKMLDYAVSFFNNSPQLKISTNIETEKIKVGWGQTFDVEQLMEHAIVHILRHQRQIEHFLVKMNT